MTYPLWLLCPLTAIAAGIVEVALLLRIARGTVSPILPRAALVIVFAVLAITVFPLAALLFPQPRIELAVLGAAIIEACLIAPVRRMEKRPALLEIARLTAISVLVMLIFPLAAFVFPDLRLELVPVWLGLAAVVLNRDRLLARALPPKRWPFGLDEESTDRQLKFVDSGLGAPRFIKLKMLSAFLCLGFGLSFFFVLLGRNELVYPLDVQLLGVETATENYCGANETARPCRVYAATGNFEQLITDVGGLVPPVNLVQNVVLKAADALKTPYCAFNGDAAICTRRLAVPTRPEQVSSKVADFAQGLLLAIVLPVVFLGWLAPDIWLRQRAASRKRELLEQMPDFLELLAACMNAGAEYERALEIIARTMGGPLARELRLTVAERELAVARSKYMHAFAARATMREVGSVLDRRDGAREQGLVRTAVQDPEVWIVDEFARTVDQATDLGNSLQATLKDQAGRMRQYRFAKAQELARASSVGVALPLGLMVLGMLITILLSIFYSGAVPLIRG